MYPSRFHYEAPRSLDDALDLKAAHGDDAKVLAGGQSLVPLLKLRFASLELLVDINNIPALDYHVVDADGTLRVGACAGTPTWSAARCWASTRRWPPPPP